jgi:adenine-specific DNA-methyltransferase
MIYIDPPYNTGNDFVYADNFADPIARYKEVTQQTTKSNPEAMGRFHTNWLNMMYPRLRLAANLLRDDGVIFISIDDNEVHNLRKLCDEIFGEENFVVQIVWEKKYAPQNDAKYFSINHEYILCYAKSMSCFERNLLPITEEQLARYKNFDNDPRGPWKSGDLTSKTQAKGHSYEITSPSGAKFLPSKGRQWAPAYSKFQELLADNRIWFGQNGNNVPSIKQFLSEVNQGIVPISLWYHKDVGHTQSATQELTKLFDNIKLFDYPKTIEIIKRCLHISTDKDSIILDFFSGTASTAHAVMQLNAEDCGNRRFIMVQLPEQCDEKSEAYKVKMLNICEIGKERIRRAGIKMLEEQEGQIILGEDMDKTSLDIGFKVFKLDTSNLKLWDDMPVTGDDALTELEARLRNMLDIIKSDRSEIDVVYEVMLKLGQELTEPITMIDLGNRKVVYGVGEEVKFIVCLAQGITPDDADAMAEYKPGRIIFADTCFNNSEQKSNVKLTLRDKGIAIKTL